MARLVLVPRETATLLAPLQVAVLALVMTLLGGAVLFVIYGVSPLDGLHAVFVEPLLTRYGIGEVLLKMAPLLLIAQGLAIGFRAQVWNIGAEGQLILGAIAASVLAIRFDGTDSQLLLPAMVVAGMLAGMAWAAIAAWLRTQFNANEILVTFMLTSVALQLLYFLVTGPLKDPMGFNFPQSISFAPNAVFPIILEGTRANASLYIGLAVTLVAVVFVRYSFASYKLSVGGLAPGASFYAGFSSKRAIWVALLVSGGAAGLAGVGEVAGPLGQLQRNISPGYGYAGIIVAVLGGLNPIGILFASAIMALVYVGGDFALLSVGVPDAVTGILQGILLISYLACSLLLTMRLRLVREAPG
ncbi:ABC transporter permease [uncultured Roseobacter sp.]|uniref:ABC transporter permease n=1 Tax=uncultured Roseobacter sp. TaxID=114847 RepID=UPI0026034A03|nr:ABC transporter permease [uncultured Roseobacter sp.]